MRKEEIVPHFACIFLQTAALFVCAFSPLFNQERIEQRETRFPGRSRSLIGLNPGANQIDAFDSDPLSLAARERHIPRQN